MSQANDQAVVYVTNWIMQHKDNADVREKMDALKVLSEEDRMNDNRFVEIVNEIKDSFGHGNTIQRNMFGFVDRDEFKKVVSDRIAEVDDLYEMSQNFADLLGDRSFRRL
jgi:hypothetical protein